jgi:hypothetical protein
MPHVRLPVGIIPRDGNSPVLDALATIAMPEDWDHRVERTGSRPVLQSYLRYTLRQLNTERKVEAPVDPGDRAAFDTGLFTPHYERIYGVAVKRDSRWEIDSFVRERDRGLRFLGAARPPRATYVTDPTDLVFDHRRTLRGSFEHIVEDNVERFPINLQGDTALRRMVLKGAIEEAVKRVQMDYRTAVPVIYFRNAQQRGFVQLLLPLVFDDSQVARLALVVGREGDDEYLARTVLTIDMAYNNARLLTRPGSDWLDPYRDSV